MITYNRDSQTIRYSLHEFGIIFTIENNLIEFVFIYSIFKKSNNTEFTSVNI